VYLDLHKQKFYSVLNTPLAAIVLVVFGWIAAFGGVYIGFAVKEWQLDQNAHAPFVIAIIIGSAIARLSSQRLDEPPMVEQIAGGAMLVLAMIILTIAQRGEVTFLLSSVQAIAALGLCMTFFGLQGVRHLWFPLVMFFYLIIWPGWAIDALTFPLKLLVSSVVSDWLYWAGLPVAHAGAVISAGPYQLLVADACAGLNSLIALTAVGAVYLYVMKRKSFALNLFILATLVPIAIFANMIRVAILVLVTYYFGYDAGQSFIHEGAGLLMFIIALAFVFLIDAAANFFATKAVRS